MPFYSAKKQPLTLLYYALENRGDKISIRKDISLETIEILLFLMYSRKVLLVKCCHYGMSLDANGCVFTLVNVD